MQKIDVFNMEGDVVGSLEVSDGTFGIEVNKNMIHVILETVLYHRARARQKTSSTKTRGEVRGGGRKPWRQKGTGRARQGSIRSPQWTGGGIVFGPRPRQDEEKSHSIPKKVRRLALKSVLSSKLAEEQMVVLDKLEFDAIKTKNMINVLKNLNVDTSAAIVISSKDMFVTMSARNIPNIKVLLVNTINVMDLLKYDKFIVTREAVEQIEEVYA